MLLPAQVLRLIPILFLIVFHNCLSQSNFYDNYKGAIEKFNEGKLDEMLKINLKALEAAEKSGVPAYLGYANLQVGTNYYFLADKKTAIKWFMTAMGIIEKNGIDSLKPKLYHNISIMYNEMKVLDSTLKYSGKAIDIMRKNKRYLQLSQALSALADLYTNTVHDFKKSEELINEAEKYAQLSKNEGVLAFAISKRSQLFGNQKKYKEAIAELNKAAPYYRKNHQNQELIYFYRMQTVYHMKLGDEKALQFNDSSIKLKDEIFRNETARQIADYETLYKTEKKERENKQLQQENLLQQARIESRNRTIIGLVTGIILIGAIVAWRISVINLKKKEKELEAAKSLQKEKERISRDLHDNVGGQLSYVLYSLEGLNDKNAEARATVTQTIGESVRNVIGNLRETIWAISDESVTAGDLSDKVKVYARSMFRNRDTKVQYHEHIKTNLSLNSLTGLNVYRICQEAINNAFKHADAGELRISFVADQQLEIEIHDNGKGFNVSAGNEEGYGMTNMKKRAEEAGIVMELSSNPHKGTTCKIIV